MHDARIQACSYLAVFYDTVEEDLTSSHDGGVGTRTMRTAGVIGRVIGCVSYPILISMQHPTQRFDCNAAGP